MSYKAFISYSHAADNQLAPTLQSALQKFAKPFYRLRAMNVFRDKTSLHLTPKLWPLIQEALRESEYFLLLASPDAAGSEWVQAEIDEWLKLKNGSTDQFLIVLTDGDISWDRSSNDFDWNKTTALPRSLQGKFATEPLFSDLRWAKTTTDLSLRHPQFLDDIGTIGATLHGKPKDVMIGKDVRQHRVFKLASGAAILVLLISVMATSAAAYYANQQKKEAVRQKDEAQRQKTEADHQRQTAVEAADRATKAAEQETIARNKETEQRKRAEKATQNEKVARQSAEERRVEAERQRNIADEQRQLAEDKTRLALSRQLSAQASNKLGDQFDLPLLLGVEAWRASPTFEARSFLRTGLERNPGLITFLDAHKSAVHGVAFSPDGKTLVSGGLDGSLRLWDVETGQPIGKPINSKVGGIWSLAFSPDGKTVAAGGFGTIALWDISSQAPSSRRLKPKHLRENVYSLAFSPDGKVLASAGADLTLWDVATGRSIGDPLTGHKQEVWSVAFSPDGKTLASGGLDKKVILWDVASHEQQGPPLTEHKEGVWSVTFSRDGKKMASGSDDGMILVWDVATRSHAAPIKADTWIRSLALSADADTLLVGGNYGELNRWYLSDSPFSVPFEVPKETVWTVALSSDDNTFATGSDDGTVILWRLRPDRSFGRQLAESSAAELAFSPNGKTLAVGIDDQTIKLVDVTTGFAGEPVRGHDGSKLAFSPDGKMLATANGDGAVLLSVATGLPVGTPYAQRQTEALAFSPNGKVFAAGGCGKSIKENYRGKDYDKCVQGQLLMWDVETHRPLGPPLIDDQGLIKRLAFSADGKMLASAGDSGQFIIWEVATRQSLWSGPGRSIAFSPDGRTLACADHQTLALWDITTRRRLTVLPSPASTEWSSVAFSPDGKMLSSSSNTKFVLWDVATRQPLWSADDGSASAFSPDSKMLATINRGAVTLWDLSLESWKARACAIANRNLTLGEWEQYFEGEPYRKTCEALPINPSVLNEGVRLAKDGDFESAVRILRRARELDSSLKFDPANEARRLVAVGKGEKLLEKARYLLNAMSDRTKEAIPFYQDGVKAFVQASALGPTPELTEASIVFNQMCWIGSLNGHSAEVMDACERAVETNPSEWRFRDSRGLGRALMGKFKGAIEDFQEFIRGTDDDEARAQRQGWIKALREGKNPFTTEELESLRKP